MVTGTPVAMESATSKTTVFAGAHTLAPSSILMGGEGDKESALLGRRRSSHEPLRVRLGTTLGGRYAVGGAVGEFRGDAFKGMGRIGGMNGPRTSVSSHGNSQPGLSVLPHGQSAESSGFGGGEMMHAGGGGGFPSTASHAVSAPSASQGASSSASGGHH